MTDRFRLVTNSSGSLHWAAACLLIVAALAATAAADSPRVFFDTTNVVACRNVTTDEFAAVNPDEKLLEAKISISSLIDSGDESELIQYFYRFESPERTLRIVDYLPQTTLAADAASNITVEDKEEEIRSLGVTLSGKFDHFVQGGAAADASNKSNQSVRYEMLPPMRSIAASGTLDRGSAVYFKLKPSPRTSFEGAKEFVVVFRVSKSWRVDYAHLHCEAFGHKRGIVQPLDEQTHWGAGDFLVALYEQGDYEAKAAAYELVDAEYELRRRAAEHKKQIERRAFPTPVHRFGAMLDVVGPRIPDSWLRRLVFTPVDSGAVGVAGSLPSEVRLAALDFQKVRVRVNRMNGGEGREENAVVAAAER